MKQFVYKTEAELTALTPAERDAYAAEKRAHESALLQQAIKTANEAERVEIQKMIDKAKPEFMVTKQQFEELQESINQLKEAGKPGEGKVISIKEAVKEQKEDLKAALKSESKEVVLKANVTRASVDQTSQGVVIPGIGQLIRIARSLYNVFRKQSITTGSHNGTIRYLDWDEVTTVKAAAMVAEGSEFPESTAAFKEYAISLKKVGDTLPVTEEFFEDEAVAAGELETFLQNNVDSKIDNQIVNGDGTGNNIKGALASVDAYTASASGVKDANIYDLVQKVMEDITKPAGNKYNPDFVGMNKTTINRLLLKKDQNDNYQFPPNHPIYSMTVEDNSIADNVMIVGDSRFATIWEMPGVVISRGYIHDQYNKDLLTLKARKRLLLLIKNSDKSGFRKVTDITAALATLAS